MSLPARAPATTSAEPGSDRAAGAGSGSADAEDDRTAPRVLPLLQRVFQALDEAAIRWALLRDEALLAEPPVDVDILVEASGSEEIDRALRQLGFVPAPARRGGSHRFHIGYSAEDGRWLKLDLVSELSFGPRFSFRTGLAEACLARRRATRGVATLDPDDEFWALLLHCLLDKGLIAPARAARLQALAADARAGSPWADLAWPLLPRPWTPTSVIQAAKRGESDGLDGLAAAFDTTPRAPGRTPTLSPGLARRLGRLPGLVASFRARRGMSVVLLGPDGSGKSTIADAIRREFPFPVRVRHVALWPAGSMSRPAALPGMDLLPRLALAWRAYLRGRLDVARRRLVVFDRYPYDAWPRVGEARSRRDRLYWTILARSCPAPDLVIILDVPGEVAHARKPEHPADHLERLRRGLSELPSRLRNVEVVDGDRSQEAVRHDVVGRVWQAYQTRWQ